MTSAVLDLHLICFAPPGGDLAPQNGLALVFEVQAGIVSTVGIGTDTPRYGHGQVGFLAQFDLSRGGCEVEDQGLRPGPEVLLAGVVHGVDEGIVA